MRWLAAAYAVTAAAIAIVAITNRLSYVLAWGAVAAVAVWLEWLSNRENLRAWNTWSFVQSFERPLTFADIVCFRRMKEWRGERAIR